MGKIAGNDTATDHKDWSSEFEGWGAKGATTPEQLVRTWFDMIDAQAVEWVAGNIPLDPWGNPVPAVYVTPEGHDLRQLLGKFLRGAVNFSQGADDYMDDDTDGKGLLASHEFGEDAYTALEHQWDEGFGYFGGARNYGDWSDDDIASIGHLDVDGNGTINLLTEVNWDIPSTQPSGTVARMWPQTSRSRLGTASSVDARCFHDTAGTP